MSSKSWAMGIGTSLLWGAYQKSHPNNIVQPTLGQISLKLFFFIFYVKEQPLDMANPNLSSSVNPKQEATCI
jgi:hypothetical protein